MSAATSAINHLKESFSARSFMIGLGVVGLLYIALCLYILFAGSSYIDNRQSQMASRTVVLEYIGTPRTATPDQQQENQTTENTEPEVNPNLPKKRVLPNPFEARGLQVMESGLAQAPIELVSENTPDGVLPKIDEKTELTPFHAYKRPFEYPRTDQPIISIAIENMGLSDAATESAVRTMPAEVSLILSPYAVNPDFWVNVARERGHEVWMHLPLETKDYPLDDPGPHTMIIDAPERDNIRKLRWLMARTQGYVGFVTSDDHVFVKSLHDMRPVVGEIFNRGLGFIDAEAAPSAIPATMAAGQNAPYNTVQLYLDDNATLAEINEKLAKIEKLAMERGKATIIIHPYPASYQAILKWLASFDEKGFIMAPLSAQTGY